MAEGRFGFIGEICTRGDVQRPNAPLRGNSQPPAPSGGSRGPQGLRDSSQRVGWCLGALPCPAYRPSEFSKPARRTGRVLPFLKHTTEASPRCSSSLSLPSEPSLRPPPPPLTSRLQFSSLHSAFFHLCFLGSEDSPSHPPKNKSLSLNQQSKGRATPGFTPRGCPRAPELTCPQPSCGSPALWMCWCRRSAELTVKPFPQSAQA